MVDFGTLCDGLYMIDLMPSLFQFSSRVSFANVVVVSKSSRNIEIFLYVVAHTFGPYF
jgi:hypothetical protein